MNAYDPIESTEDLIDSREVIARIEYLASREGADPDGDDDLPLDEDEVEELKALRALAEQGSGFGDWSYGVTLIRDSYFEDYARDFARDNYFEDYASWPATCIDWAQAATELQTDYSSVEYDGETYWLR